MPHDANGNLIQVGDKVVIPATVLSVHEGTAFCNCDVEFDYPMPPYTDKTRYSALNTRQVEKVGVLTVGVASAEAGEAAYRGYFDACGGKSLISGAPLPTWEKQSPEIQAAWRSAAAAVDLFFGRAKFSPGVMSE